MENGCGVEGLRGHCSEAFVSKEESFSTSTYPIGQAGMDGGQSW